MRKKHTSKLFFRALSLLMIVLLLLPFAVSCKARPLGQTKLARTEVGNVDKYPVLYEEFYFLAHNYYEAVKDEYKNDPESLKKAVWDYVNENIVANYAILKLCETEGILYDESELKDDVKTVLELTIASEFEDSRSDYLKNQKAMGLTDHYVRFVTGVDLLYDRLANKYMETGVVPNTDEKILSYIKENFVHTWHIAIFVDENDDRDTELAKANEALSKLNSGEMTMLDLMGSRYNEDLIPPSTEYDGYYFPKGVMEQWYENAAFSLEIGEHSDVIKATGSNNKGEYVECFYIIERLASSEEEIRSNFDALSDEVSGSIIAEKMQAIKDSLKFTPNDFALSLDVHELEAPKNGVDYQLILVIALCVLSLSAVIVSIVFIRKMRRKRFHASIRSPKK